MLIAVYSETLEKLVSIVCIHMIAVETSQTRTGSVFSFCQFSCHLSKRAQNFLSAYIHWDHSYVGCEEQVTSSQNMDIVRRKLYLHKVPSRAIGRFQLNRNCLFHRQPDLILLHD